MEDLESRIPGFAWIFFFFTGLLLFAAALAGVTTGTATSAVAQIANIKIRIADFLMRLS